MKEECFIGIDVGGTHMRSALVDAKGGIVVRRKTATRIESGAEKTAGRLVKECGALIGVASARGSTVKAVGLGVAGKIDSERGVVLFSPNLRPMDGYPLVSEIDDRLGLPTIMENDANAFGIGEARLGAGRGIDHWLGITLGTGVGGCIVLGGKLWTGDGMGFAGEFGHTIVQSRGLKCLCGSSGCLEAYSSGRALVEGAEDALESGRFSGGPLDDLRKAGKLNPKAICRFSEKGDVLAKSLLVRMGWALGLALCNLFTAFGVRTAILGGGVGGAFGEFIRPLMSSLKDHAGMFDVGEAKILRGSLGDDAALLGSALLAAERFGG